MKLKVLAIFLVVFLSIGSFIGCSNQVTDVTVPTGKVQDVKLYENLPDGLSEEYYNGTNFQVATVKGWETNVLTNDIFVMNTPDTSSDSGTITVSCNASGGIKTTDLTWEKFSDEMKNAGYEVEKIQFGRAQFIDRECLINEYSMQANGQKRYVIVCYFDAGDNVVSVQLNRDNKDNYVTEFYNTLDSLRIK